MSKVKVYYSVGSSFHILANSGLPYCVENSYPRLHQHNDYDDYGGFNVFKGTKILVRQEDISYVIHKDASVCGRCAKSSKGKLFVSSLDKSREAAGWPSVRK